MKPTSLRELYVQELKDLYDAEQQITKALPKMLRASTSEALQEALSRHLEVTKEHVSRLEEIFARLEEKPKAEKCKGIHGVIEEGDDLVEDIEDKDVRDAAIIASAQKVEHYEMAAYGTVRNYARLLGDETAGELLQRTLDEEKEADQVLTQCADHINVQAQVPGDQRAA